MRLFGKKQTELPPPPVPSVARSDIIVATKMPQGIATPQDIYTDDLPDGIADEIYGEQLTIRELSQKLEITDQERNFAQQDAHQLRSALEQVVDRLEPTNYDMADLRMLVEDALHTSYTNENAAQSRQWSQPVDLNQLRERYSA